MAGRGLSPTDAGRRGKVRRARFLLVLGLLAFAAFAGHGTLTRVTRLVPPKVVLPTEGPAETHLRTVNGLREVILEGSPEAIGAAQTRSLRDRMIADESRLWGDYEHFVPWWLARLGIEEVSRVRYRKLDRGIPEPRRRELAAESLAFAPDPFEGRMPTYQRMVFLHALYDIALSFEHSPLIGCSTFALGQEVTRDGHVLAARAFDMETDEVLDEDKAVFLVREDGALRFASVAWPGFVGVVTGMNEAGVFVVVHGGRAGEPRAEGMPVAFSLREVLSHARDTDEAVAILRGQDVMVSHIVFVADARGRFAVVERAPGVPAFVRSLGPRAAVTNQFEGPLSSDPKNARVVATTSSTARAERLDELLSSTADGSATPEAALAILRDHGCARGVACELGDRRSIDALIATHGVVADLTERTLWVGIGPHLSGRFVPVDVRAAFNPSAGADDSGADVMPEDAILRDGRYARAMRARASGGAR
jgi:isopenicillin-N N-acyltransferase-like protein